MFGYTVSQQFSSHWLIFWNNRHNLLHGKVGVHLVYSDVGAVWSGRQCLLFYLAKINRDRAVEWME